MRISDWSSDVCSSDLLEDIEPFAAHDGDIAASEGPEDSVVARSAQAQVGAVGAAGQAVVAGTAFQGIGTAAANQGIPEITAADVDGLLAGRTEIAGLGCLTETSCLHRLPPPPPGPG